jgi:hypothetical protein
MSELRSKVLANVRTDGAGRFFLVTEMAVPAEGEAE